MNATMMLVCLTASAITGQPDPTVFKAPRIQVKTGVSDSKTFSYLLYNRVYLGRQYDKSKEQPDIHRMPTTYFHDKSPIGVVLKDEKSFPPKKEPPVLVLGMDVGTLAAYAQPGQTFHFTERVPTFVKLSQPDKGEKRYFSFVQDAIDRGAKVKIFEGEPREMLEKHAADKFYKVIVVESYKLPVVEIHKELLTKEGVQSLVSKLREDGILCYHTSNRYYKMAPILGSIAEELKLACIVGKDSGGRGVAREHEFRYGSEWVMLARDAKHIAHLKTKKAEEGEYPAVDWEPPDPINKKFAWTDKGEQSFRGLYFSDPNIDKWHDVLHDLEAFARDTVGISDMTVYKSSQPLHDAIRAWSKRSVDALNREGPESPKKKEIKSDEK